MNKIVICGRLTNDPEVRYLANGTATCTFNVAVNRKFAKDDQQKADFIPVVVWSKLAEACGNNLIKGQRVIAEGRLQIRSYETTDGQKRRVSEVVAEEVEFLDKPGQQGQQSEPQQPKQVDAVKAFSGQQVFPPEEQIPF